jgi:hypothetical protein
MSQAVHTLKSRGDQYGPVETSFDKISKLATIVLNKTITPYDVAGVLHAVKLARMSNNPHEADNYIDGINYMAFMAQFAGLSTQPDEGLESGIAEMARRFAPRRSETGQEVSE